MTSQARIQANRQNSLKSTGPKTPEGRAKSSMNALKHGMRSKRLVLLDEESYAFENRRMKWLSSADPDDDMGEFLVNQCVSLSFEVERVGRAHLERLTSLIENADESELDAVHELGKRLFYDPTGPTPMYGNRPDGRRKLRTSWNGQSVDPNDPAVLARQLESSAIGCCWMREVWEELRAQLEPPKFWQSHDRLKAIRLLGRQPLDAIEDRQVAEIFVASSALDPAGHKPFDDLLSDMGTTEHVHYRKAVRARWPDLVSPEDKAGCRQILIELADRNIERLDAMLEVYEQNADADAQRTVERLGFDQSPEGNRIRQYKLKCNSGFFRAFEALRKYQNKKQAKGGERRIEYGGLREEDSRRRVPDAARWPQPMAASDRVPDRSFAMGMAHAERETFEPSIDSDAFLDPEAQPGCGNGTTSANPEGGGRRAEDGGKTDPQFLPPSLLSPGPFCSEGMTLPEGPELAAAAGVGGSNASDSSGADAAAKPGDPVCPQGASSENAATEADLAGPNASDSSDADAPAEPGDPMCPQEDNTENATNEANVNESVSILQSNEPVEVTANSGVDSGLDKPEAEQLEGERNDGVSRGTPPESAIRLLARIASEVEHRGLPPGAPPWLQERLRQLAIQRATGAPLPGAQPSGEPAPAAESLVRPPP